jgi:hypothetical protein
MKIDGAAQITDPMASQKKIQTNVFLNIWWAFEGKK